MIGKSPLLPGELAAGPVHETHHAADRWVPWTVGEERARIVGRVLARIRRHQRDRDARQMGYVDLGEAGA